MPRLSEMDEIAIASVSDGDRIGYFDEGGTNYVITMGVMREAVSTPSTDHSGALGDATHRWLAAHVDQVKLYGGGSVVASTPLIDGTQTWNNAAVAFVGAKINVTDTASDAASLLLDLQINNTSKFKVSKGSVVTATTFDGDLTGNADTATLAAVATAAPASGLTGATMAAGVTGSSLTSLGRIASLLATKAQSGTTTVSVPTATTTNIGPVLTVSGVYLIIAAFAGGSQTAILAVFDAVAVASAVSSALISGAVTVTAVGNQLKVAQTSGVTKDVTLSYLLVAE